MGTLEKMGAHITKKWVHNKKMGTRNLQSSPKPETRTIAKNSHPKTMVVFLRDLMKLINL